MPLVETLVTIIGPAIAKTIFSSWLKNAPLANQIGEEIIDYIKDEIIDSKTQREMQRGMERVGEQIATKLRIVFEQEASSLPTSTRHSIAHTIAEALHKAKVTNQLLMSINLDAGRLAKHLRASYPEGNRFYSLDEKLLYDRLLMEASLSVIGVAPQLEGFAIGFSLETLKRLDEIADDLRVMIEQSQRENDEFEQKYRSAVVRELDRMEMFGLPRMDTLTSQQSLSMAYITLSAIRRETSLYPQWAEPLSRILTEQITDTQLDVFSNGYVRPVDHMIAQSKRIIIRGGAGAGKSTLLQWLAVRASKKEFPSILRQWNSSIPFFIRLRTRVDKGFPKPGEFIDLVARNHADNMPKGWVQQKLDAGNALVLIDGVDELPVSQRQTFLEDLERLIEDFPRARYIITSRPTGLKNKQGDTWPQWENWTQRTGFIDLSLEPMSASNVDQFIAQWHKALTAAARSEDREVDLKQTAHSLQRLLRQRPELRRLATTPLLTAMICALHRERGDTLPAERIKLYEECIEMLLSRREEVRRIALDEYLAAGLGFQQKREAIQSFAYWLMLNNYSDVEKVRADTHFDRILPDMQLPTNVKGAHIREFFVERAGLLREPIVGRVDFTHRTFQEFLAAKEAIDTDSIGVLLTQAHNDQWREVIIVATGLASRSKRTEMLQGLLEISKKVHNRHYVSLLAVACLETAIRVEPKVRQAVIEKARALLPPKDNDEVSMVAKAGDAIAPLLDADPKYSEQDAAKCVEALARIGSSTAMKIIGNYADYDNDRVARAISTAWDAFDRIQYAHTILTRTQRLILPVLVTWEGFEYLSHLTHLTIEKSNSRNIEPIANLSNLTTLDLGSGIDISSSVLARLSNLTTLTLRGANHRDLTPLSNHPNLTNLTLYDTSVRDLTPLASCLKCETLILEGTAIRSVKPLANHPNLSTLMVRGESLHDILPLTTLPKLTMLSLNSTGVSNLSSLSKSRNLTTLTLRNGVIRDLKQVSEIYALTTLTLIGPVFSDISPLTGLANLTNLSLIGTGIRNISPIANMPNLTTLNLVGPSISDISPLSNAAKLTTLILKSTNVTDISSLSALRNLKYLKIEDSPVHNVFLLEAIPELVIEMS